MRNHTPGPWFAVQNSAGMWDVNVKDSDYGQTVSSCGPNRYIDGDAELNACLISAAPDLLEALEYITDDSRMQTFTDREHCRTVARKAIAKARGES